MTQAVKVRLRFAKRGDLRLTSHHDVMRCFERMIRRASIPVASTQGFSPRPKITFALAMGLGIAGLNEVVDVELTEPTDPDELKGRLAAASPAGIDWLEAEALEPSARPPRPAWADYEIPIPEARRQGLATALEGLLQSESRIVTRRRPDKKRDVEFDMRPLLLDARLTADGTFCARLKASPDGSVRPEEVLECLGVRDLLDDGAYLTRTHVELAG
ncbi:TIGR03936 family radical SAM-associated protein [Paludisphaera mucosa]|uniref:TIGR03936 family radical SAM-associated protein n=1 Tax=Paludisphaera mucosa TaxID=3030827 RepID=A0ABT6FKY2_9BACT|nr:TIGR03936 family radical SAM-associated protein [Paludisphaera mucosa]MDG3008038.1 TIGR03936 family radical SAM-associated protein [Paludisphaera mucosa]